MQEKQSLEGSPIAFRRIYRWVLSFLIPYRVQVGVSLALGIIISAVYMLVLKFIQIIVDDILPNKDTSRFQTLMWWMSAAIILVIFTIVKRWIDQNYQTRVSAY